MSEEFNVDCFTVCRDVPVVKDGILLMNSPLFPCFSDERKALTALSQIKSEYPDAKLWRGTAFFGADDVTRRQRFIDSLV